MYNYISLNLYSAILPLTSVYVVSVGCVEDCIKMTHWFLIEGI